MLSAALSLQSFAYAPGAAPLALRATSQRAATAAIFMGVEQPDVRYGENSDWKPESTNSKSTMSGGFESTDTPDFFTEESEKLAAGIDVMDGVMGSTGLDKLNAMKNAGRSDDPGVAGALDVNPDIYVPEAEEIVADESEFHLPASGMTDMDFEMKFAHTSVGELKIDVRPVAMTFEEFYVGFTPDSHPAFSVTPTEGRMERRNGPPTELTVTCDPQGKTGELEAHLCFILPEEKAFSTFYKITAKPF